MLKLNLSEKIKCYYNRRNNSLLKSEMSKYKNVQIGEDKTNIFTKT